ncbi:MAG: hypothetical protein ACRDAU_09515 [Clostridium sp.]
MRKELIMKVDMVKSEDLDKFLNCIEDKIVSYRRYGDEVSLIFEEEEI